MCAHRCTRTHMCMCPHAPACISDDYTHVPVAASPPHIHQRTAVLNAASCSSENPTQIHQCTAVLNAASCSSENPHPDPSAHGCSQRRLLLIWVSSITFGKFLLPGNDQEISKHEVYVCVSPGLWSFSTSSPGQEALNPDHNTTHLVYSPTE